MHIRHFQSSLRQKVSVVCLSGQSIRFSAFPLACPQLRGNSQNTEASAGSVAVQGHPGCDLHSRHVITTPTEPGAAGNLGSSGRLTGKLGFR